MCRTLVRGVLLLCLLTNLVSYAQRSADLHACARADLRAFSASEVEPQWASSSGGSDLLLDRAARSRFVGRIATARLLARPRLAEQNAGALARTPHRLSAAHRQHLKLLAALARDDDSPA